jgi:hypothetical protein
MLRNYWAKYKFKKFVNHFFLSYLLKSCTKITEILKCISEIGYNNLKELS